MDLAWLDDFEALAESANFSRAAARRHVTQPAFSRRIRALEDWAGTPLFERGPPAALTPAGERVRPLLADIRRRLAEAREEARLAGEPGSLRFAATHALSFSFFPGWLGARGRGGPAGPVHLISDGLDGCEAAMRAGRAQFLLCHAHPAAPIRLDPPAFLSRPVGRDRLVLLASPDRPDAPVLGYGAGSGLGRILAAAAPEAAPRPGAFTSGLAAVLHGMALDGHGIAWLPESLAAPDLAAGRLVRVDGADPIAVAIRLVRPAAPLGPEAERFWAALGGAEA